MPRGAPSATATAGFPRADRLEKDGVGVVIDKFRVMAKEAGRDPADPADQHLPRARQDRRAALLPGDRHRPRHLHPAGGERRQAHAHHRSLGRAEASAGRLTDGARSSACRSASRCIAAWAKSWDKSYRESDASSPAEADRLGFDSIWASEHHGEDDGYCPSPVVACAALAVAAPHCRIGQAVALAPLHGHPLRLAEDLSVVDNLSRRPGRDRAGAGLSPRRVRDVRLALCARARAPSRSRWTSWAWPGAASASTTRAASTR